MMNLHCQAQMLRCFHTFMSLAQRKPSSMRLCTYAGLDLWSCTCLIFRDGFIIQKRTFSSFHQAVERLDVNPIRGYRRSVERFPQAGHPIVAPPYADRSQ